MVKDFSAQLNAIPEGWVSAMGVTITHATKDEVRAELTIGTQHLQGYGIVHGGVHCGIIETLSSMGAYLFAWSRISRWQVRWSRARCPLPRPSNAGAL